MQGNTISVDRVIGAPASTIFALLCDPREHSRFDGSGTVAVALTAPPLSRGSRFGMRMRGRRETLFLPYRTTNTVIEFEPERRISWQTTALGGLVGGRIWRYDLSPVDSGSTRVRETWDISHDRQPSFLKRTSAPALTEQALRCTLDRIDALLAAHQGGTTLMTTTTPTSTSGPKDPRRVKVSRRGGAAPVAPMRRSSRHHRWLLAAAAMTIAVVATVLAVLALTRHGAERPSSAISIPATPIAWATGGDGPPPWPAPTDVAAAVARSGLPLLRAEGTSLHIHAHLDVIVDGTPLVIPAGIGIDERGGTISPLHTHDSSGVIHVESPTHSTFTLAEFFSEWNVTLSASHIGSLSITPGSPLRAYVNGHQVPGTPGALTLHSHDEIALVYGSIPAHIPGNYNFVDL